MLESWIRKQIPLRGILILGGRQFLTHGREKSA